MSLFPRRRRGFTLVELLVVIGIIALLISILLPSLNRARASAQNVVCLSNLRQVGTGLFLYADGHDGMLPYGYWDGSSPVGAGPNGNRANDWSNVLLQYLDSTAGGGSYVENAAKPETAIQDALRCPSAQQGNALTQYSVHPRLMPSLTQPDGANSGQFLRPQKLGTVKDAPETLMMADATLFPNVTPTVTFGANAVLYNLDKTPGFAGIDQQPWMVQPIAEQVAGFFDRNVAGGTNEDRQDGASWGRLRFRHGSNDNKDFKSVSCNILWADAHASSQRGQGPLAGFPDQIDTGLNRRTICVYP